MLTTTIMKTSAVPTLGPLAGALALCLGLAACDAEGEGLDLAEAEGAGEVQFRGGGDGPWGTGKLNTNFLGEDETYPLNTIPLSDDPEADIRLHAVWATHCVDRINNIVYDNELFYTSDLDGELGIGVSDGELTPTTFRKYGDESVTCTVAGRDWKHTIWGVITRDDQDVLHNNYLMIMDRRLDPNGNRIYKWGVLTGNNPFVPDSYTPTCDEDEDPDEAPFGEVWTYRYYAYLIDGLAVDPDTGAFSSAADTLYTACRSGAVGKAVSWNYAPWEWGSDVHELATFAVRADYCGDGTPYTEEGNRVQLDDDLGINDFVDGSFSDEAAWDLSLGRASCVTTPREHDLRQGFSGISCEIDGQTVDLPPCDPQANADATIRTKIGD